MMTLTSNDRFRMQAKPMAITSGHPSSLFGLLFILNIRIGGKVSIVKAGRIIAGVQYLEVAWVSME